VELAGHGAGMRHRSKPDAGALPAADLLPDWLRGPLFDPNAKDIVAKGARVAASARPPSPPFLTIPEAAHVLRLSIRTIRRMLADGRLEAVRLGRAVRVRGRDLDKL
jgi:excisionase family DNA binding protein